MLILLKTSLVNHSTALLNGSSTLPFTCSLALLDMATGTRFIHADPYMLEMHRESHIEQVESSGGQNRGN